MVLNMCYDAGNVQHFLEVRHSFSVKRGRRLSRSLFLCFPTSKWRYIMHMTMQCIRFYHALLVHRTLGVYTPESAQNNQMTNRFLPVVGD